ncbi:MAG: hypothetical protein AB8B83_04170, partial [Bdellovibrionales bacterium]
MNDVSQDAPNDMPLQSSADENRLTADDYDDFLDALDLLYLRGNLSARLKFFENWPIAAHYIFGDELIAFDRNGTTDTERRAALEDAAEDKRLELLELVATLEEKSVEKNVLQAEYVEQTIKMLGRDLSLLMYATKFVDRYCPDTSPVAPPLDDVVVDQPVNTSAGVSSPAVKVSPDPGDVPDSFDTPGVQPVKVKPVIEPLADDALDGIQPISVEPQGVKTVSETPLTTRDADPVSQVEGSVESSPVQQSTAPEHSVETSVSVNPVAPVSSSSGSVSVASPVSPPPPLPAEKVPSPASIDQQSATPVQQ